MTQDWVKDCASEYLKRIIESESIEDELSQCWTCEAATTLYKCADCLHQVASCASCMCAQHTNLPSHRFKRWTGRYFEDVPAADLGYVFNLGHGGSHCALATQRTFTLGDTNGLHEVQIRFCRHPGRGDFARQLLKASIYPCSDIQPASGFTFSMLRQFHLLSTEAKLSSQRYYNVLSALTNNIFPHLVPPRYKEFMRVQRQWEYLQDLKRAGQGVVISSTNDSGDPAL